MKSRYLKIIGIAALMIIMLPVAAQLRATAQESSQKEAASDNPFSNSKARALEGSWTAQVTLRNCATGQALGTFPTLNTFMQGGTLHHDSASVAPTTRGSGHGVWKHEGGQNFTFALQFFRFNADGTYAGLTIGRRQALLDATGNSYSATVTIEFYNPAGILVGTGCATETATRFE